MSQTTKSWKTEPYAYYGVYWIVTSDGRKTVGTAKTIEDAHLIAAAPDLLEAAIAAIEALTIGAMPDQQDTALWLLDSAVKDATK